MILPAPPVAFTRNTRCPDPSVVALQPEFLTYRVYSSSVEQLASGCHWAEGPVWLADHRCLLWSSIPGNRILRWDDQTGQVSPFRAPSNHANGLARDLQGRLLACEHLTRRRHPHRARWRDHGAGQPFRRPAAQLTERHRLPAARAGRRQRLVHRPALRHPRLLGG